MAQQLVVVVNSYGVLNGRVEPNIEVLQEAGFLVLKKLKFILSADQAEILINDEKERSNFTKGPICCLLLKRDDAFAALGQIKEDLDDFYYSESPYASLRDQTLFFPRKAALERTVVIIKPGHSDEDYSAILQVLNLHDFVVIGSSARMISEEQGAALLGADKKEEIAALTDNICVALTVEKMSAVEDMLLLLGPKDPELARQVAPNTLRALLGKDRINNMLYSSSSYRKALQDIEVLFPEPFPLERTLALIKPDAVDHLDEVKAAIQEQGFTIIAEEKMYVSKQRAEELYAKEKNEAYFEALTQFMSSGALVAMILCKPGAVRSWQTLIGPADPADARVDRPLSLRALYGTDEIFNAFHASENVSTANTEIDIFFPQLVTDVIPSVDEVETMIRKKTDPRPNSSSRSLHEVLVEGLVHLCQTKPVGHDAVRELANWLAENNPNKPQVEQPEEEVVVQTTTELVQAAAGQALSVVWVIGSPGSKHSVPVQRLAAELGYEYISATEVLQAVQKSGSEFGRTINQYLKQGRPLPTHIVISVVKDSILNSKKASVIIDDFPANLDMAFHFEKTFQPVDRVLFFEGPEQELLKAAFDGESKEDKDSFLKQLDDFNREVFPVVEHYQTFEKVLSISSFGSHEQIYKRVRSAF